MGATPQPPLIPRPPDKVQITSLLAFTILLVREHFFHPYLSSRFFTSIAVRSSFVVFTSAWQTQVWDLLDPQDYAETKDRLVLVDSPVPEASQVSEDYPARWAHLVLDLLE